MPELAVAFGVLFGGTSTPVPSELGDGTFEIYVNMIYAWYWHRKTPRMNASKVAYRIHSQVRKADGFDPAERQFHRDLFRRRYRRSLNPAIECRI